MSIRRQVLDELEQIADVAVAGIVGAIEREAARRRAEACMQYAFHLRMAARLPRWRRLARAIHRALARRSEARCDALRAAGDPIACALCSDVEKAGLV